MVHDLIVKNATLVDPGQGIDSPKDVAFAGGAVAEVGDDLSSGTAHQVIDATGLYLTPGLIDVHVHVYPGVSHYGIDPDPTCLARGVTTVVDAGSAGHDIFPGFRRYVIEVSETRIVAMVNISCQGMVSQSVGEFALPDYASVDLACKTIETNRDLILGVKVRLTRDSIVSESAGMIPLQRAREAANAAGLPIMVHPQAAWCDSLDDILAVMKKDDILTHCYHGMACGILNDGGHIRESVRDAIDRGVIFDVGHGAGSFTWEVVESALEQGVLPQTISSDLHIYNVDGPVYDLANVMTKFLHLGLSLEDVIAKVTSVPATAVLRNEQLGTLAPGTVGDAVLLELLEGQFELRDCVGAVRTAGRKLEPVKVIRAGRVYRQLHTPAA